MISDLVSVLLPAFNCEKYIENSIQSILEQTYKNIEIIVIDDCSTDNTYEKILDAYKNDRRIRPFRNEVNLKLPKTLNKGIVLANGGFIARMDADDWSFPERIAMQYQHLKKTGDVLCGGAIEVCGSNMEILGKRYYPEKHQDIIRSIYYYSPFCHPSIFFKKAVAIDVGGYNEKLDVAQDYDFYFRMANAGKVSNLNNIIHQLRLHSESSSSLRAKKQELNTIYIRIKSMFEYDYKPSKLQKIYSFIQFISIFVLPHKIKFKFFNFLRNI